MKSQPLISWLISRNRFLVTPLLWLISASAQAAALQIAVQERGITDPLACQIYLADPQGKPVKADDLPFFRDHFVCPGSVTLNLPPGRYTYEIERGPEYSAEKGSVTMGDQDKNLTIQIERIAHLASEGWWSGELHVHRRLSAAELLMRAADLHVAPVITWWNNDNPWRTNAVPAELLRRFDGDRFYHVMGGEDEREGGALLFFNLRQPLPITGATREHPSPMSFVEMARRQTDVWIDIEKPFWWDVPVWLASGKMNSIGLANNHMCRSSMLANEAWGKPRDTARFPGPRGNGFWTQEIYYKVLDSGLRLPPSAGSASGVLPNPVGYNRVYVYLKEGLDHDRWWQGLAAGQSFVSNGPLLRCRANGELPGHTFRIDQSGVLRIDLDTRLSSREERGAIEVVRNGTVVQTVPWKRSPEQTQLARLEFRESGWFLVRAVADVDHTFRFASTAPFYVDGPGGVRISRKATQFFLDWTRERRGRVKIEDPAKRAEVLQHHDSAEKFWQDRLTRATAP